MHLVKETAAPAPDSLSLLRYIADMTAQMAELANNQGFARVAVLLEAAVHECEDQLDFKPTRG